MLVTFAPTAIVLSSKSLLQLEGESKTAASETSWDERSLRMERSLSNRIL